MFMFMFMAPPQKNMWVRHKQMPSKLLFTLYSGIVVCASTAPQTYELGVKAKCDGRQRGSVKGDLTICVTLLRTPAYQGYGLNSSPVHA